MQIKNNPIHHVGRIVLQGIIVAPIVEEYLFRGMYFTSLQEVITGSHLITYYI